MLPESNGRTKQMNILSLSWESNQPGNSIFIDNSEWNLFAPSNQNGKVFILFFIELFWLSLFVVDSMNSFSQHRTNFHWLKIEKSWIIEFGLIDFSFRTQEQMNFFDLLSLSVTSLSLVQKFPQIYRIYRTKNVSSISTSSVLLEETA